MNALSAVQVLILSMTKSTRLVDSNHSSAQALHSSVRYTGMSASNAQRAHLRPEEVRCFGPVCPQCNASVKTAYYFSKVCVGC